MRDRPAGCSPAPAACAALCVAMEMVGGGQRRWFVGGDRTAARIRRRAGDDGHNARRPANTTLAATQRHLCRSGMVTADCARSRLRPESVWRLAALKDQRKIPSFTFISHHSRARGADDGGCRRRNASYGVARDSNPVSTTAVRGLSWHRSLSGARARRQRRACEIDLRGARLRQQLVRRSVWQWRWSAAASVDGLLVAIGRRRGFGAGPAMMVITRGGPPTRHSPPPSDICVVLGW